MSATSPAAPVPSSAPAPRTLSAALTLGALGVVYGDIGTSPLYTVKEIFNPALGIPLDAPHLIGAVSVIVWGLLLVVTLKYVWLVLRADNRGEGGIVALSALALQAVGSQSRVRGVLLVLGIAGAALFYGDSVITPAISVLGAVEGLEVLTPALKPYVLPVSAAILVGLFAVQRSGTGRVGAWFGPVILMWFAALAWTGLTEILREPGILAALDPRQAWAFLRGQGWQVFAAVGAIVLAFTGAEALYADLAHFGRGPIRLAWSAVVLPSLALQYLGQGALLMRDPAAIESPFYRMFPESWLVPALVLATLATIIASQAVISGAYSMTRQAMQLGLLPRLRVVHTSAREEGQIYLPLVNWLLLACVLGAVLGFGSSSALASAYGIAVTGTMLITTVLTFFVVRHGWHYPAPLAWGATGVFLAVDALLLLACLVKFLQGGWFPAALGLALFVLMRTWQRGHARMLAAIRGHDLALRPFVQSLARENLRRMPRSAVFLAAAPDTVPHALLHNLRHNGVLHERNLIVTVVFHDVPWIGFDERLVVEPLAPGFWAVQVHYGFKNTPDLPQALALCRDHGLPLNLFETSYFLSREIVVPARPRTLAAWSTALFERLHRNESHVAGFFRLPDNGVVEMGTIVPV